GNVPPHELHPVVHADGTCRSLRALDRLVRRDRVRFYLYPWRVLDNLRDTDCLLRELRNRTDPAFLPLRGPVPTIVRVPRFVREPMVRGHCIPEILAPEAVDRAFILRPDN